MEPPTTVEIFGNATMKTRSGHEADSPSEWMAMLGVAVGSMIVLLGAFGNVISIVAYCRNSKLQIPFNHLITNLCAVDLVFSSLVMPTILLPMAVGGNIYPKALCAAVGFLYYCTMASSVVNLVMIAANRYIGIVRSGRYKTMFSDDRTKWWVLLVWLSAPMLYLAFLLTGSFTWRETSLRCALSTTDFSSIAMKYYHACVNILLQIFPAIALMVLYRAILKKVKRCRKSIELHRPPFASASGEAPPQSSAKLSEQNQVSTQQTTSDTSNWPKSPAMNFLRVPSEKRRFGSQAEGVGDASLQDSFFRNNRPETASSPNLASGAEYERKLSFIRNIQRRRSCDDKPRTSRSYNERRLSDGFSSNKQRLTILSTIDSEPTSRAISLDQNEQTTFAAKCEESQNRKDTFGKACRDSYMSFESMQGGNSTFERGLLASLTRLTLPNEENALCSENRKQGAEEERPKRRRIARVDRPLIFSVNNSTECALDGRTEPELFQCVAIRDELSVPGTEAHLQVNAEKSVAERSGKRIWQTARTDESKSGARAETAAFLDATQCIPCNESTDVETRNSSALAIDAAFPPIPIEQGPKTSNSQLIPSRATINARSFRVSTGSKVEQRDTDCDTSTRGGNKTLSCQKTEVRGVDAKGIKKFRRLTLPTKARTGIRPRIKQLRSISMGHDSDGSRLPRAPEIVIDHASSSEDNGRGSLDQMESAVWMNHSTASLNTSVSNRLENETLRNPTNSDRRGSQWLQAIFQKHFLSNRISTLRRKHGHEVGNARKDINPSVDPTCSDHPSADEERCARVSETRYLSVANNNQDFERWPADSSYDCLSWDERRPSASSRMYRYSVSLVDDTVSFAGNEYQMTRNAYARNRSRDYSASNGPSANHARRTNSYRRRSASRSSLRRRSVLGSSGHSSLWSLDSARRHRSRNVERHLVFTGMVICAAFALCVLPTSLIAVVSMVAKFRVSADVKFAAGMLSWLHAVINPVLYGLLNPSYRREFRRMLRDVKRHCERRCVKQELSKAGSQANATSANPANSRSLNPPSW